MGSEYQHIRRSIAKIEAEQRTDIDELVSAARNLVARVKLDLMLDRHIGWGGGVIERVEAAIAKVQP